MPARLPRSRLDLGVHVPGRCRVAELELPPPTRDELSELVQGRMASLRPHLPQCDALPVHFPFSRKFIDELGATESTSRSAGVLRRCARNTTASCSVAPGVVLAEPPLPTSQAVTLQELERVWDNALADAGACWRWPGPTSRRT